MMMMVVVEHEAQRKGISFGRDHCVLERFFIISIRLVSFHLLFARCCFFPLGDLRAKTLLSLSFPFAPFYFW